MKSIWQTDTVLPEYNALEGDTSTDVLVIGGGIAGLLTAYLLKQSGIDCIVVEKRRICSGTTGCTTAKITAQHGLCYNKLLKRFGLEKTRKYLLANTNALDRFAELCKGIDCDFEYKDNYVYSVDDVELLQKEMEALNRLGYGAKLCDSPALPFDTAGAVMFQNQAQFHPLKFLSAIARSLTIYEDTFVREIYNGTAITDRGKTSAKAIVVTTHFPFINKHGSYFIKLYQHRSYVMALKNACDVGGMYVDECDTGMSFRNYKDFLLLGGGGHRTGKKGGGWAELQNFADRYYPDSVEVCRWAAQDCMSLDKIPYIGQYSGRTAQLFTATGFNKWGMTGAMVSAVILSDLIAGKDNEYADVFNPSRSILTPQLLINSFESAANLLSFGRKRCPHLGCALHWNSAEHSWDCACHGSRLSEDGSVLDNPANGK